MIKTYHNRPTRIKGCQLKYFLFIKCPGFSPNQKRQKYNFLFVARRIKLKPICVCVKGKGTEIKVKLS